MDLELTPSQFYTVRRDTTIRECIRFMQEKSLSFLLIENSRSELVGIFTLKDLLKSFKYLRAEAHLKKPVGVVMSRPLLTINLKQIDQAKKIMSRHNIRHLPVVTESVGNKKKVVGVIDMESLLKSMILNETNPMQNKKNIVVYSPNGALVKLLKHVYANQKLTTVEKLWSSKLKTDEAIQRVTKDYDIFYFDLDNRRSIVLAHEIAKKIKKSKKKVVALIAKQQFRDEDRKRLIELSKHPKVQICEKPINIHDLTSSVLKP